MSPANTSRPVDALGLHDDTCVPCSELRRMGQPTALAALLPADGGPYVVRVFDAFRYRQPPRDPVGGWVLHVLRQLAGQTWQWRVVRMDCSQDHTLYRGHALLRLPTVRVYAGERQVTCPALRALFPPQWHVCVQGLPRRQDLRLLGCTGRLPKTCAWTDVDGWYRAGLMRQAEQVQEKHRRRRHQPARTPPPPPPPLITVRVPPAPRPPPPPPKPTWFDAARTDLCAADLADPMVARLHLAITTGEAVDIRYEGGSIPGLTRRIQPRALFAVTGYAAHYVRAWDVDKNAERVFRLDRLRLDDA